MSSPPRSIFSTWSLCYIPRFVLFCPAYACPSTTHTVSITEHWRISTNVLACNSFGYVVSSNNNHPQVCLSTNPINQYPPVKSCVSLWFSPVTHHHPVYFLDLVITSKNNLLCVPPRHTLLIPALSRLILPFRPSVVFSIPSHLHPTQSRTREESLPHSQSIAPWYMTRPRTSKKHVSHVSTPPNFEIWSDLGSSGPPDPLQGCNTRFVRRKQLCLACRLAFVITNAQFVYIFHHHHTKLKCTFANLRHLKLFTTWFEAEKYQTSRMHDLWWMHEVLLGQTLE